MKRENIFSYIFINKGTSLHLKKYICYHTEVVHQNKGVKNAQSLLFLFVFKQGEITTALNGPRPIDNHVEDHPDTINKAVGFFLLFFTIRNGEIPAAPSEGVRGHLPICH